MSYITKTHRLMHKSIHLNLIGVSKDAFTIVWRCFKLTGVPKSVNR